MQAAKRRLDRLSEKVKVGLGKTDPTVDDLFISHVEKFNKEEALAKQYRQELRTYLQALKTLEAAFGSLMGVVSTVQDKALNNGTFGTTTEKMIAYHQNLAEVLTETSQHNLQQHLGSFIELKHKISKRNKRLTDYDASRHNLDEVTNAKKKDDTKITKATEMFDINKDRYEKLNNELHDELPIFHDDRVSFYSASLLSVLNAHTSFYNEMLAQLDTPVSQLNLIQGTIQKRNHVSFTPAKLHAVSSNSSSSSSPAPKPRAARIPSAEYDQHNPFEDEEENAGVKADTKATGSRGDNPFGSESDDVPAPRAPNEDVSHASVSSTGKLEEDLAKSPEDQDDGNPFGDDDEPTNCSDQGGHPGSDSNSDNAAPVTPAALVTVPATTTKAELSTKVVADEDEVPSIDAEPEVVVEAKSPEFTKDGREVMFKLKGVYQYLAEDDDELTFEVGDSLSVVEWSDSDDKDEGWLKGVRDCTGVCGVFPANYTDYKPPAT